MGDVMGEINKRRGRVLGMNPGENGMQVVEADVPMAEMGDFATFIRQCTQAEAPLPLSLPGMRMPRLRWPKRLSKKQRPPRKARANNPKHNLSEKLKIIH